MAAKVVTVAFEGVEARRVDVEVQLTTGQQVFVIVGLADKAVAESRERVRGAFAGLGLSLPGKRIVANLAPADMPKEGTHFDLPIALAVMAAIGVIPLDALDGWAAMGELSLDGRIVPAAGALPAAMAAGAMDLGLICPESSGPEAAWAGGTRILAPRSLVALINHFRGSQVLSAPAPGSVIDGERAKDLRDVKGQEHAKRALEIAAAGGHNLLFVGPPGSGKSMLAQRLPSLLPSLTATELLQTSMVHSVAGLIARGALTRARPFRAPHHSASMAALTGGGHKAKPGEVSLAHNGVLFLDELPEFGVQALDSLRAPLETGEVMVARANAHVRYPAKVQLVAAMNPCRCGHGGAGRGYGGKAPRCQRDYQGRVSGPLMDRIDLSVDMPAVTAADLVGTLNDLPAATVFAPTNDAFAAIPKKDLKAVLADKELLSSILTYHVIGEQLDPEAVVGEQDTLNGDTLTIEGDTDGMTVQNGDTPANVLCGNIPTANATVYVVDAVLMP